MLFKSDSLKKLQPRISNTNKVQTLDKGILPVIKPIKQD